MGKELSIGDKILVERMYLWKKDYSPEEIWNRIEREKDPIRRTKMRKLFFRKNL